jgi:hypothetical protein
MPAEPLPLFPLRTVLFPGMTLALRVFETRYVDMVRRCMRRNEMFCIVAIRRGDEVGLAEIYRVGTLARIVDWSATADGLLGLEVCGERRCRFERSEREADGLNVGFGVSVLADEGALVSAGHRWARELLGTMLEQEAAAGRSVPAESELADANRVCWNLAQRLPLGFAERQALLEIEDLEARFERLRSGAALAIDPYGKE